MEMSLADNNTTSATFVANNVNFIGRINYFFNTIHTLGSIMVVKSDFIDEGTAYMV